MNWQINISKQFNKLKAYCLAIFKWVVLGVIIGIVCGLVGVCFSKAISFVTELRALNNWILYFLPLGGIAIVYIYRLCRVTNLGTNDVLKSVRGENKIRILLAPAIFLSTIITHLCGGSSGREGAALQLGASVSAFCSKIFRLDSQSRHILTMCGMGAVFSAVFGTPIGAFIFAIEVVSVGTFCSAAFLPAIISSFSAFYVSHLFKIKPERFILKIVPDFSFEILYKTIIIAVSAALVSFIFCKIMHISHKLFEKFFKNEYLKIFVGGVLIVLLTIILGTTDYNGGGIEIIERIFNFGEVRYEAFVLKLLFTAITISVGFKGGEIVPTLFIGATFGASMGFLLNLDPAFSAALGIAALFCGVTNCPIATLFICIELFGGKAISYLAISTIISFVLSGYTGLYSEQKFVFSKISEKTINKNAN
ncbi:MAG: chloride channel protein [Clostridia bacterium]|nr:chloride channel protein [Clostridia bacterium]